MPCFSKRAAHAESKPRHLCRAIAACHGDWDRGAEEVLGDDAIDHEGLVPRRSRISLPPSGQVQPNSRVHCI